ncbi:GHKL domain-containing protein [Clostridium sp. FP2]|uniref:ATP-binding protein n=1 Tax=Clostridium sp. FP2 TaxID=2724481 RepID=UPI0013E94A2A|nr:ATP-binding protein [Clostridium sp. FP2]MBZ9621860.1 GHKL domain-containing protein [Clostridium sp. FP2]
MIIPDLKKFYTTAERLDMEVVKKQSQNFNANDPYLKALDSMNIFIIILNSYRQIVYANKTYLKLLNIKDISDILGKRLGESLGCINFFKNEDGCGTSSACQNCSGRNIVLKSIALNQEVEDEVSIIRKIDGFDVPVNSFAKVVPIEINKEIFYLASFIDATDSVKKRSMEKIFFHDVINTAGALKGILNLLKTEVPPIYENEVAQVEGLFEGLIDEIQSQKQILAAENNELFIELEEFNSKEVLRTLKKLYKGYSDSLNKTIKIAEDSISIDLKNDITLLKRVVGNMLKNALEATMDNGVVTMGCSMAPNEFVQYWIRNSSYIRADVQNSIFKRAFSTKGKDRGLGTYSMKLLGEKYLNGSVGFTSSKAYGTCFYINIPKVKF